jgi:signal transduction histidine kinase
VRLSQTETFSLEIRDDGPGFTAPCEPGGTVPFHAGLRNLRDRLEAVGGSLTIDSAPGRGTRLIGRVPLQAAADATRPEDADPAAEAVAERKLRGADVAG